MNDENLDLRIIHNKKGIKIIEKQIYKNLKNGYAKNWRDDGSLESEYHYWKDMLHGTCNKWDEDGILISQSEYLYGRCISHKRLDQDKNWLVENFEIDEYEQIKDRTDISELYKLFLKYISYDINKSEKNFKDAIKEFEKTAIIINTNEAETLNDDVMFKKSLLGKVNICKHDEEWPVHNGISLLPLIQINVSELPFIPDSFKHLKYLAIFIVNEEAIDYYGNNDTNLLVRTYIDEDINYLPTPAEISINPRIISYETQLDFPTYEDLAGGIKENLKSYKDPFGEETTYESIVNDKLLGWPFWCQSSELESFKDAEFILQISDHDDEWLVGDCSTLYVFRCLKTNKYFSTIQMY